MGRIAYVYAELNRGKETLDGKFRSTDIPTFTKLGYEPFDVKGVKELKEVVKQKEKEITIVRKRISILKSKKVQPVELPAEPNQEPTAEVPAVPEAPKRKRGRPKKVVAPVEPPTTEPAPEAPATESTPDA